MNQNWIIENLNNAFSTWNGKLTELWGLVTTGPNLLRAVLWRGQYLGGVLPTLFIRAVVFCLPALLGFSGIKSDIERPGSPPIPAFIIAKSTALPENSRQGGVCLFTDRSFRFLC